MLRKKELLRDKNKFSEEKYPIVKYLKIYEDLPVETRQKRNILRLVADRAKTVEENPDEIMVKGDKLIVKGKTYGFEYRFMTVGPVVEPWWCCHTILPGYTFRHTRRGFCNAVHSF